MLSENALQEKKIEHMKNSSNKKLLQNNLEQVVDVEVGGCVTPQKIRYKIFKQ